MADFFGFGNDDGSEDDFFSKLSSQSQSQQTMFDLDPFSNPTSFESIPITPEIPSVQDSFSAITPVDDYNQIGISTGITDFQIEPQVIPVPENQNEPFVPPVNAENENEIHENNDTQKDEAQPLEPAAINPASPEAGDGDENEEEIIPGEAYIVNEARSVPPIPTPVEHHEFVRTSISPSRGMNDETKKSDAETAPKQNVPMFKVPMMPLIPQIQPVAKVTEPEIKEEKKEEENQIASEECNKEIIPEEPKQDEKVNDVPEAPIIPKQEEKVNDAFEIPIVAPGQEEKEITPEIPIVTQNQQGQSMYKIPMMPSIPQIQPVVKVTELETKEEKKEEEKIIPEEPKQEEKEVTPDAPIVALGQEEKEIIPQAQIITPKQQEQPMFKVPMMPSIPQIQPVVKVTELETKEEKKEEEKSITEEPKQEEKEVTPEVPIVTPKQQGQSMFKIPMMPSIPQIQPVVKVTELETKEEKKEEEKVSTEKINETPKQQQQQQQLPQMYKVPMMTGVPTARPTTPTKRPRMFIPTFPAIPTIPKMPAIPATSNTQAAAPPTSPSKGSYKNLLSDMPPPPPPITPQQAPITPTKAAFSPSSPTNNQNTPVIPKPSEATALAPLPAQTVQPPKQRMKSHPAVSFGFGGRMVKSTGTNFTILKYEDAVKPAIPHDIYAFPGPLLHGDEQSMTLKLKAFICGKLQQKRKEPGKEVDVLLWELIELLCEKPSPEENLLAPGNRGALLKILGKHRKEVQGDRRPLRTVREIASEEVRRLYAEERYEEAFTLALEEGCICQAIVIAQKVPGSAEVLARRVATDYIPDGDSIKLGYMLDSQDFRPVDLFKRGNDFVKSLTSNWISTIIEVAKAERLSLMYKRAIVGEIGDRIWATEGQDSDAATKAHICYLIADFGFGAPQDAGTRISLIGWDHLADSNGTKENFMHEKFLEFFEMTEIYEFLYFTREYRKERGLGNIDEQRYKFFCVFQLRKFDFLKFLVGLSYEKFGKIGINYINSINGMISKFLSKWSTLDQTLFSAFKVSFNEYARKIKVYITAQTTHNTQATAAAAHVQNTSPSPTVSSPSPSVSPTANFVSKITQSSSSWFGWMVNKK